MAVKDKEVMRAQPAVRDTPWEGDQAEPPIPAIDQPSYPEIDDVGAAARYRHARARVQQLRDFYVHAFMYVLVNLALLALNLITSPGYPWFLWVTLGWGVGLAAHAFVVFGTEGALGKRWEERKIRELMERDEQS